MAARSAETPLMRQYWDIKRQHADAILLFRLGDFYEMFFDDAEVASKILDITLTSRDKNSENPVPLCGVPYHSISGYISQLLDQGHKVAICEQVEDPKVAKGIVRREVVRVVTPGMRTDAEGLAPHEVSPLLSLYPGSTGVGLAWIDVSSGRFRVTHLENTTEAREELWRLSPREVIFPEAADADGEAILNPKGNGTSTSPRLERLPAWAYDRAATKLCERFSVGSLEGFGISDSDLIAPAAHGLLHYIEKENRTALPYLETPTPYFVRQHAHLDRATRENLEIFRARGEADRSRSLYGVLDETRTAMGSRRLREWLHFPLREKKAIDERLDGVEEFSENGDIRETLRTHLSHVYDLERLIGRIAGGRANARDLVALRTTLEQIPDLKITLEGTRKEILRTFLDRLDPHAELVTLLKQALVNDPPLTVKEGGMIRNRYDENLDELREISGGGRQWVAQLEAQERARTGISSLKVRYNKVFGYYIEVTKSNLGRVPDDYDRKQTLTGSERFITPALKEQESKILGADEKIGALEYDLFERLREKAAEKTASIQALASALADLDVLAALGRVAIQYRYVRPTITEEKKLTIRAGRHPVVERFLTEFPFVPNHTDLDCEDRQLIILTGPNMAGKSTIMRQAAMIVLLAQIGSFVPAEEAEIGLVDRIFTRVGASDDLAGGRSTFMVEMSETANILHNATDRSLILLDEIGRGTSTFDGLSIAWAVAEDIHDRIGARTIFATHYHELTDLARTKSRVHNMNVAIKEWGEKIVFLHTLTDGAVNRSYGIDVARLAGVPKNVIARARRILANLEKGELDATGKPTLAEDETSSASGQLELFRRLGDELIRELESLDPEELSPREALDHLYAWKKRFRKTDSI